VSNPTRSGAASAIGGVRWGAIARHVDERGSFRELWRAGWFPEMAGTGAHGPRFVQANLSSSAVGVLRGLHLHRRQLDFWVVADGRAWIALVDARPMLDGTGDRPVVETREIQADATVTIPAGVAHGFLAIEPLQLAYFVTAEYDATDELGFAWDDPLAAIPWPLVPGTSDGRPILSGRDRANPSLAQLVERLRAE
jgi:dTDP-4-dehydrorhamnose 3,5-epimerase